MIEKYKYLKWYIGFSLRKIILDNHISMIDFLSSKNVRRFNSRTDIYGTMSTFIMFIADKITLLFKKLVYELYLYDFVSGRFAHRIADWLWETEPILKT